MKLIKTLLITIFLATFAVAQYSHRPVIFPETTTSDSFNVPNRHQLGGLQFPDTLGAGMDTVYFLVSSDLSLGFDTLWYNGVKYFEILPVKLPFSYTLKLPNTFAWEWWKICFRETLVDSITFYPVFDESKK